MTQTLGGGLSRLTRTTAPRSGRLVAHRSLRLESLETRALLSASSVGFDVAQYQFQPQTGGGIQLDIGAPVFLEIMDLNGDGYDDVLAVREIANEGRASVEVSLFNPQSGSYAAPNKVMEITYNNGTQIALGDLTGDLRPDLVVASFDPASSGGSKFEVYVGNGSGGFAVTPTVSTVSVDTIATLAGIQSYVLANSSVANTFMIETTGASMLGVGFELVVFAPPAQPTLYYVQCYFSPFGSQGGLNTGTPTPFHSMIRGEVAESGDLDGDGLPDFVTIDEGGKTLRVYTTADRGAEAYRERSYALNGDAPRGAIALEDLDGDGKDDIIVGVRGSANERVTLWLSAEPEATKLQTLPVGMIPYVIAAGDLTGDPPGSRVKEIVLSDYTSGHNILVRNGSTYIEQGAVLTNIEYKATATADINGDGFPDLLAASTNVVTVRYGTASGTFGAEQILLRLGDPNNPAPRPGQVQFAEVTGDQWLDLVVLTRDNATLTVYAGGPNNFSLLSSTPLQQGASLFALADLGGSALPDIVTLGDPSRSYRVLINQGNGQFNDTGGGVLSGIAAPSEIRLADINRDGRPDLVVLDSIAAEVSILLNNGSNLFPSRTAYSVGTSWSPDHLGSSPMGLTIADLNGDGWLDLATANFGDGEVAVLYNNNGQFGGKRTVAVGGSPSDLAIADVNYDGRPDIVVGRALNGRTAVVLGHSDPSNPFQTPVYFGATGGSGGIVDIHLAYADNNGSLDILMADGNTIHVFRNQAVGVVPGTASIVAVVRDGATPRVGGNGEAPLPTSRTWVDEFGTYWIEVWATGGGPAISSFSFGLAYDTAQHPIFTVDSIEFGPAFTQVAPTIPSPLPAGKAFQFVAGQTTHSDVGDNSHALLARVKIRPTTGTAGVPVVTGRYPEPITDLFSLAYQQVTLVGGGTTVPTATNPSTTVWPVSFDTNDDGMISRLDYLRFIPAFGKAATANPYGPLFDINRDGIVDRKDYQYFVLQYGASNTNNKTLAYPPGYPAPASPSGGVPLSYVAPPASSPSGSSSSTSDGGLATLDLMFASYDAWE